MTLRKTSKNLLKILLMSIPFLLAIIALSLTLGQEIIKDLTPSLTSFLVLNFLAYLLFLTIPIETIFIFYLFLGYNALLLFCISVFIALFSQVIDYSIGYLISTKSKSFCIVLENKKIKKYTNKIHKYGKWIIFLFNLFPISSPIMLFVAGLIRFDFKKAISYSFFGLLLKYSAIITFFYFIKAF